MSKTAYEYPFSRRWILLSLILSFSSLFLSILILGVNIYLFIVLTLPQVLLFTMVKNKLYKRLDATDLNPLLYLGESDNGSFIHVIMLVALVFFGFALPFILLLFLEPVMWFISLLSFAFGINTPEIVLFLVYRFKKRKKRS